jgi:glycosyltransferase involved in cell wall biosynthesis
MHKKSVLIVTPFFPPQSHVGGLRPAMFSKYLPFFGWEPIILTRVYPENDEMHDNLMPLSGLPPNDKKYSLVWGSGDEKKAQVNRKLRDKIIHFLRPDISQPPGYVTEKIIYAEKALKDIAFDLIFATSPHLGCLTVGAYLANKFKKQWVADFRDIIEQDKFEGIKENIYKQRILHRRKKIVQAASAVVTVSQHHAKKLESAFSRPVDVIYNGYDHEKFALAGKYKSNKFLIVYMGRLLSQWLRDPQPLFEALDLLLSNGKILLEDLEINFYGTEPNLLNKIASNSKCMDVINVMPRVPYDNVPEILKKSCINLVLTNKDRHGILTTKVFEYLAVGRPTLCIPGDGGELENIIESSGIGFVGRTVNEIAEFLMTKYDEWKETKMLESCPIMDIISFYSRKEQTRQLVSILDRFK